MFKFLKEYKQLKLENERLKDKCNKYNEMLNVIKNTLLVKPIARNKKDWEKFYEIQLRIIFEVIDEQK